jgi:endogenous inhibitor of DNA gyrase (YacG/DUF329 family)
MSLVLIKCPETGRVVSTGIEMERATFDALPNVGAPMKCPACASTHVWSKKDAWLAEHGEGQKRS